MHFLWKEDKSCKNHENPRQQLIDSINNSLPRFASRAHKNKAKELLNLIMLDKFIQDNFEQYIKS